MAGKDGISSVNHKRFNALSALESFQDKFSCSYYTGDIPVHAKAYVWCKDDTPVIGYVGSANYTNNGFSPRQKELMVVYEPSDILKYYYDIQTNLVYVHIRMYRD